MSFGGGSVFGGGAATPSAAGATAAPFGGGLFGGGGAAAPAAPATPFQQPQQQQQPAPFGQTPTAQPQTSLFDGGGAAAAGAGATIGGLSSLFAAQPQQQQTQQQPSAPSTRVVKWAISQLNDSGLPAADGGRYLAISLMDSFRDFSFEELRVSDYARGDNGGENPPAGAQLHTQAPAQGGLLFGQQQQPQQPSSAPAFGAAPGVSAFGATSTTNPATPFGAPVSTTPAAAPGGLFGLGASSQSLFGGGAAVGGEGLFGASTVQSQPQQTSLFGAPPQSQSLFGAPPQSQSLFGTAGATAAPAAQTQGLFGAPAVTAGAAQSQSLFGAPAGATSQPSLFGGGAAQSQPSSLFGGGGGAQSQPASSLFGGGANASATQPQSSLFNPVPQQPGALAGGGGGAASNPSSSTPSLFGAPVQPNPTSAPSLFGAPPSTAPSLFSAAPLGQSSAGALGGGGGLFGSTFGNNPAAPGPALGTASAPSTATPSLFGAFGAGSAAATGASLFGAGNQTSLFGGGTAAAVGGAASEPGGLFGFGAASSPAGGSLFGATPGLFGSSFGTQQQAQQQQQQQQQQQLLQHPLQLSVTSNPFGQSRLISGASTAAAVLSSSPAGAGGSNPNNNNSGKPSLSVVVANPSLAVGPTGAGAGLDTTPTAAAAGTPTGAAAGAGASTLHVPSAAATARRARHYTAKPNAAALVRRGNGHGWFSASPMRPWGRDGSLFNSDAVAAHNQHRLAGNGAIGGPPFNLLGPLGGAGAFVPHQQQQHHTGFAGAFPAPWRTENQMLRAANIKKLVIEPDDKRGSGGGSRAMQLHEQIQYSFHLGRHDDENNNIGDDEYDDDDNENENKDENVGDVSGDGLDRDVIGYDMMNPRSARRHDGLGVNRSSIRGQQNSTTPSARKSIAPRTLIEKRATRLQREEHHRTQQQQQQQQRLPTDTLRDDDKDDIERRRRRRSAAGPIDVDADDVNPGVVDVDADADGDAGDGVNGRLSVDVDAVNGGGGALVSSRIPKADEDDLEAVAGGHGRADVHAQRHNRGNGLSTSSPAARRRGSTNDDGDNDDDRRPTEGGGSGSGPAGGVVKPETAMTSAADVNNSRLVPYSEVYRKHFSSGSRRISLGDKRVSATLPPVNTGSIPTPAASSLAGPSQQQEMTGLPANAAPTSRRPDAFTEPPPADLRCMADGQLAAVHDFAYGVHGVGRVTWPGTTDVRGMDLDALIHIRHGELVVYPEDGGDDDDGATTDRRKKKKVQLPPQGSFLNKQARVELHGIWKYERGTKIPIKDAAATANIVARLKKHCDREGLTFLGYDVRTGTWSFRAEHF